MDDMARFILGCILVATLWLLILILVFTTNRRHKPTPWWGSSLGWYYNESSSNMLATDVFPAVANARFSVGRISYRDKTVLKLLVGRVGDVAFTCAAVPSAHEAKKAPASSVCAIELPMSLPELEISPRRQVGDGSTAQVFPTGNEPFDERFQVRCVSEEFARTVLTPAMTKRLVGLPADHPLVSGTISVVGSTAMLWRGTSISQTDAPIIAAALARLVYLLLSSTAEPTQWGASAPETAAKLLATRQS
jgi:hypothetical protein